MKYIVIVLALCLLLNCVVSDETKFQGRIIGGTNANVIRDFAVRIISALSASSTSGYLSSGVAITPNHVVTVGQAISGFGIWYIGHGSIHVSYQLESVSTNATAHPNYDGLFLYNNIGLIRVADDIGRTISISSPIISGLVFGYGVFNQANELPGTLQQNVIYSMPDNTECIPPFNLVVIRPDNKCSVLFGGSVSSGDQGAPVTNTGVSGVHGIVSFWNNEGNLAILVDLNAHIDFIESQLF